MNVLDVADLPPKFVLPKLVLDPNLSEAAAQSLGYLDFYENTLGRVFDVRAVSQNRHPLGKIIYQLESVENKRYAQGYFELTYNRTSATWYLECVKKIDLDDRDLDIIELTIRAIETANIHDNSLKLITDMRVHIRILNGDLCPPKFDKDIYEFSVLEGT